MVAFAVPSNCLKCEKKTKNLKQVNIYGGHKEKKVGDTTTISIGYSPSYYLCEACISKLKYWIKNEK